jgi:flavin-dependent dehydrogenase
MATNVNRYDIAIVGGGLAGLSLAIQMQRVGVNTVLFEKEQYPFHRVCGEYISMESYDFIEQLGVPLSSMNLPRIQKLTVTAPNGLALHRPLKLGGFGISRYLLDAQLASQARNAGVTLIENCKVMDVDHHSIYTSQGLFEANLIVGTWGKRSRMDASLVRHFLEPKQRTLSDYVGIKYHVQANLPEDTIALHNFKNGYCGISKVENDTYCMCYLVKGSELKNAGGSIQKMEETVLKQNPHLKHHFEQFPSLYEKPLAISQISFESKTLIEQKIIMAGDAAGLITPLCGNGMSMALHASKLLASELQQYFQQHQTFDETFGNYANQWKHQFANRLRAGRWIQSVFGNPILTTLTLSCLKPFPKAVDYLIRQTHGKPF